ncbi:MAG: hypothetical protein ACI3VN_05350 [Candidatus Onthomonas sp.]
MAVMSLSLIVLLLVLLAVFVGFLFLERFLARQESRYPGLILPGIQILGSLIPLLNLTDTGSALGNAWSIFITLLMGNLPTALYLLIYFTCRKKRRQDSERQRMNIQDLN